MTATEFFKLLVALMFPATLVLGLTDYIKFTQHKRNHQYRRAKRKSNTMAMWLLLCAGFVLCIYILYFH